MMKTNIILKAVATIVLSFILQMSIAQNTAPVVNTGVVGAQVCDEPAVPVAEAHVLVIEGSTYKNSCIRAGSQYNSPSGCEAAERAWKKGQLFECTNPPGKIPYHEGDEFNCYHSGGIFHIEIKPNAAKATADKTKDY